MPTVAFLTFGCKVNQYDAEALREAVLALGYEEVPPAQPADVYVVSTCTVTAEGFAKSRRAVLRAARRNPKARILVVGCSTERDRRSLRSVPQIALLGGHEEKELVPLVLSGRRQDGEAPPVRPRGGWWGGIERFHGRTRACVKVQDGCALDCSYCIIPKVRPVLISRPIPEVLDEIRRLVDRGHREIVLTGIHLGCYGAEIPASEGPRLDLVALLRAVVGLEGEFRVRLSSLEAAEIDVALLHLMADFPERICFHLHVPLQSGSNAVLKRMRRRYTAEQFLAQCDRIRSVLGEPALTTDVIVGFPGETDDDFEATCRAVRHARFAKIHVFRFSPREGTLAATMPDQVPPPLKQRRAAELAGIGRQLRQAFYASLIGQELQVVGERVLEGRPSQLIGTADRYVRVRFPGGPELMDRIIRVRVEGVAGDCVLATNARAVRAPNAGPT